MTRAQFLNDLYHRLESLTREQAEQHLTYYAEMLADRMEEGMSEEQAVESMEDLDTIARRILEEEGLPAAAPADPPAAPPAYPDASRIPGGGGTRAYQPPKKRDWRKGASVLLWGVAILCLVGALGRWRSHDMSHETSVAEGTDTVVQEALEEVVVYSDGGRAAGDCQVPAEAVSTIFVRWTSGAVEVEAWDGGDVRFAKEDDDWFDWSLEDGALNISSTGGTLVLRLPGGLLSSLHIETSSADVTVNGVNLEELRIATISGDISAESLTGNTVYTGTTSGDIRIGGLTTDCLEISTTSGDVQGDAFSSYFTGNTVSGKLKMTVQGVDEVWAGTTSGNIGLELYGAPGTVDVRSRSGDIDLALPEDLGFELTFDTVSGDADMEADCTRLNGVYTRNGGGCAIYAVTISGDLRVGNW